MKINCLYCGHGFAIDDSYCDYEGLLRCATCGGLLHARIEDGMIRSVRPGSLSMPPVDAAAEPTDGFDRANNGFGRANDAAPAADRQEVA